MNNTVRVKNLIQYLKGVNQELIITTSIKEKIQVLDINNVQIVTVTNDNNSKETQSTMTLNIKFDIIDETKLIDDIQEVDNRE